MSNWHLNFLQVPRVRHTAVSRNREKNRWRDNLGWRTQPLKRSYFPNSRGVQRSPEGCCPEVVQRRRRYIQRSVLVVSAYAINNNNFFFFFFVLALFALLNYLSICFFFFIFHEDVKNVFLVFVKKYFFSINDYYNLTQ